MMKCPDGRMRPGDKTNILQQNQVKWSFLDSSIKVGGRFRFQRIH